MKKLVYLVSAIAVFAACQKEDAGQQTVSSGFAPQELYATIEDESPDTRIHLGQYEGKYRVLWDADYNIAVCAGNTVASKYTVKSDDTPSTALALKTANSDGTAIDRYVGYYPYPNSGTINVADNGDGTYTVTNAAFSDSQTYQAGSFADRAFPLVAVSGGLDDYSLDFKNAAGGLCINLVGETKVKQMTLTPNQSGAKIAGNAQITVSETESDDFTLSSTGFTSGQIQLVMPEDGIQLDPDTPTPFYLGVAPQTFTGGFKVSMKDVDGDTKEISTTKDQTITRSKILDMPTQSFMYRVADLTAVTLKTNGTNLLHESSADSHTFTYNVWNTETAKADYSYRGIQFPDLSGDFTNRSLKIKMSYCDVVLKIRVCYDDGTGEKEITHSGFYSSVKNLTGTLQTKTISFADIVGASNVGVLSNVTRVEFWCGGTNGSTVSADDTTLKLVVNKVYVD